MTSWASTTRRSSGGSPEVRLHHGPLYNSIFRADDQLLMGHCAYHSRECQVPMLRLDGATSQEMTSIYMEEFDRIWASANPLATP